MKPTTGLFSVLCSKRYAAACSSACPPISPIIIMPGEKDYFWQPLATIKFDTFGLWVLQELIDTVDEVSAVERITTNSNASRLP